MPRQTAADKAAQEVLEAARAAIIYTLTTEGEGATRTDLRSANAALSVEALPDDDFDATLAELIASGVVIAADNDTYILGDGSEPAVPTDDDLFDDDERIALPNVPLRAGYGYLVIEAPLDLVTAFSGLHPADAASMASRAAGELRAAMRETGRMRTPLRSDTRDGAVAIVVPGYDG